MGGASTSSPSDFVVEFARVMKSSLADGNNAVQWSIEGVQGFDLTDPTNPKAKGGDGDGSGIENAEQFSALGVIGRPLPPSDVQGINEHAEVCCIKTVDGLVPISTRDTRLRMQGNGPGEGTLAFVGYGGGFHSTTPVAKGSDPAGGGTIHVLYCPYDFDNNGIAQKAHTITMDPTPGNESIIIAHAEGMAITMGDDGKKELLLKNAAGDATFRLDDDGITMTATQIVMSGGVIIGDPLTAVPLLPGPASPGSTKLFVSP